MNSLLLSLNVFLTIFMSKEATKRYDIEAFCRLHYIHTVELWKTQCALHKFAHHKMLKPSHNFPFFHIYHHHLFRLYQNECESKCMHQIRTGIFIR